MKSLKAALAEHEQLSGQEMLAVVSQLVGNLIAMQDQRKYTPAAVMDMVAQNIEIGNKIVIDSIMATEGRS